MKPVFPPPLQILSLEHMVLRRPTESLIQSSFRKESKSFEHLDFLFLGDTVFHFHF